MHRHRSLVMMILLLTGTVGAAEEGLSRESIAELKAATVFVRFGLSHGETACAGFIVHRDGKVLLVATNASTALHPDRIVDRITVVFNSGGKDVVLPGTFVASLNRDSVNHDLALIKVECDLEPVPLRLGTSAGLRETGIVYLVGHPFGQQFISTKPTPPIAISKATISSLRKDDLGVTASIKVLGIMEFGNRGGPVVNHLGEVIGVSGGFAEKGYGSGFVMPVENLRNFIHGALTRFELDQVVSRKGEVTVNVKAWLIDPLSRLTDVTVLMAPADQVGTLPQANASDNEMPRLAISTSDIRLVLDKTGKDPSTGTITLSSSTHTLQEYLVQVHLTSANGRSRFNSVWRYRLNFTGSIGASAQPVGGDAPTKPLNLGTRPRVEKTVPPAQMPMDLGAAAVAVPTITEELVTPLSERVSDLAVAGDGRFLVLAYRDSGTLTIYDADEGRISRSITLAEKNILFAAGGNVALVYGVDAQTLTTYDLTTGEVLRTKKSPTPAAIINLAMGRARGDRALVRHASLRKDNHPSTDACQHMLIDLDTLEDIPWRATCDAGNRSSLTIYDQVALRTDATLSHATEWSPPKSFLALLRLGDDSFTAKLVSENEGAQQVGDDGRIYTAMGGVFDRELARTGRIFGQRLFAGIGGILYLGMDDSGRFTIYQCGANTALVHCGTFPGREATTAAANTNTKTKLESDKQVIFDPIHGRLLLIPDSADRIIRRPFNLTRILMESEVDYLVVTTRPPATATVGKAWTYRIQALSRSNEIRYALTSGPAGMTVTANGTVSWTPPAPSDRPEHVTITLTDKTGDECQHLFDVWVPPVHAR